MANKYSYTPRSLDPEATYLNISWPTNGASNPASFKGRGVQSITRSNPGEFTVTFDDNYYALLTADAQLQLATFGDSNAHIGTYTAGTGGTSPTKPTLLVWTDTNGAQADIAAATGNNIFLQVVFRNSVRP